MKEKIKILLKDCDKVEARECLEKVRKHIIKKATTR